MDYNPRSISKTRKKIIKSVIKRPEIDKNFYYQTISFLKDFEKTDPGNDKDNLMVKRKYANSLSI